MQINVLVTGGIYSAQSGFSALRFCRAAVKEGHRIAQVFFYQDGVSQGSVLSVVLQDEFDPVEQWAEFATANGTDLIVCVSAAERRGIINRDQAAEFGKTGVSLHPAFQVEGLGVLHSASLESDRTVTFK